MLEKIIDKKIKEEIKELGIPQHQAEEVINKLKLFYGAVKKKNYTVAKGMWGMVNKIISEELERRINNK